MTPCGMTQRQRQTTTTGRMLSLSLLAIGLLVALLCCSSGVQAQRRSSLPVHSFNVVTVPVLSFNIAEANGTAGVGLAGRSIDFVPAFAGISLPISSDPDSLLRMNIMLPHKDDDPTGCSGPWRSMNEFNQSFAGSFVLQRQSTCLNTVNYLYAAMSGARGVIAYGCPTTEPFNCAAGLLEILVYTRIHTATVLSITNEDGEAILAYLNEAKAAAAPDAPALNSMVLEFVSTGPIVPEERAALVSMMKTTTMFPFAGGQVPAAQDLWSVARFNSSTLDPCRDRVKGLWCERSHVVWVSPWYHAWLGPVPAEFGELTHLRAINLFASRLRGAIPESWCNLHDLRSLAVGDSLAQPFITSFPACMGSSMPLLEELYFSGHGIKHLPASFSLLTNLRYLEGPRNEIAGPLFDLTQMPNLTLVSLSLNRFNGSLPALHPAAPLSQFGMSGNLLTGTIDPGYFANKPLLRIIDVNSNALSGSLPPLTGCPNLEIVDFSTNAFSGPVPGGLAPAPWSALQRLKTLNLQENSLVSPVFLANLQALTRINLSNNRFNSSTLALPNNENFGVWMDSIFSPNLVSLRCSYNDLRGPWGVNAFVTSKTIQEIFVDHNGITSIPNEFFVVQALQMDVSYNDLNLTSANFPISAPHPLANVLNFAGNPKIQLDTLPYWAKLSSARTQAPGENFACAPLLSSTAALLTAVVDATFFKYKNCECSAGFFGKPPLCSAVPSFASLSPFAIISSNEVGDTLATLIRDTGGLGSELTVSSSSDANTTEDTSFTRPAVYAQSFSDGMYGENRLTVGMSTRWVMDLSNVFRDDPQSYAAERLAPPSPLRTFVLNVTAGETQPSRTVAVRVIHLRLHLSREAFTEFEDQLSVYEGGSDLKGARVATIRGTDAKPDTNITNLSAEYLAQYNTSLLALQSAAVMDLRIFAPTATLQFTSRSTSGLHFFASYSYDFECPSGFFFDSATTHQCQPDLQQFRIGEGIRAAVWALSSVALGFCVFNIVILLICWESLVFKAASRSFMLLTLIFLFAMAGGALLYAAIPTPHTYYSEVLCIARAWLTCLPLAGILSVLLAKNARLNSIFGAQTLQVKKHTDSDICRMVLAVCLIQIGILLVFTILPLSLPELTVGAGGLSDKLVKQCSQESGFMQWTASEIVFIFCLMLPAGYLGWKTRDLPSQYSESSHIQNALILLLFFGVIIIPLDIFIQDSPEAAVLIQGLGQSLLCLILTLIIFGPKLYFLWVIRNARARMMAGNAGGGTMLNSGAASSSIVTKQGTQTNLAAGNGGAQQQGAGGGANVNFGSLKPRATGASIDGGGGNGGLRKPAPLPQTVNARRGTVPASLSSSSSSGSLLTTKPGMHARTLTNTTTTTQATPTATRSNASTAPTSSTMQQPQQQPQQQQTHAHLHSLSVSTGEPGSSIQLVTLHQEPTSTPSPPPALLVSSPSASASPAPTSPSLFDSSAAASVASPSGVSSPLRAKARIKLHLSPAVQSAHNIAMVQRIKEAGMADVATAPQQQQ